MNLDKYRIKIYTRSMNKALYDRAMFFIDLPYPKVRLENTTADGYIYQLIEDTTADIIINIDEDAFVSDLNALKNLLQYVVENEYVNCGMPDGGVVHLRRANPLVTNPYFNILNVAEIRKKISLKEIESFPYHKDEYMKNFPVHLLKGRFEFVDNEPYCRFFVWLSQNYKTLYLDSYNHPDGESTVLLNHEGIPFLIHTWYSRFYGSDYKHTKRIDNVVSECERAREKKFRSSLIDKLKLKSNLYRSMVLKKLVSIKKEFFKKKDDKIFHNHTGI